MTDDDGLGALPLRRVHDQARGLAGGPDVLDDDADPLEAIAGLVEDLGDGRRLGERARDGGAVVGGAELVRIAGSSGISSTASTIRRCEASRARSAARSSARVDASLSS